MKNILTIIGPSGSGKTAAGRNLDPKTTLWIVPENKELPFPGGRSNFKTLTKEDNPGGWSLKSNFIPEDSISVIQELITTLDDLLQEFKKNVPEGEEPKFQRKVILIDTLTYAMLKTVRVNQKDDNWNKYIMFAEEVINLIDTCKNVRSDIDFIFTAHEETIESKSTSDVTLVKQLKTPAGRFMREKVTPEGLFTTVLYSECRELGDNKLSYDFRTQSGSGYPSKSPMGLFKDLYIANDYKVILKRMHEYYEEGIIQE